jgi:hypothetical protein
VRCEDEAGTLDPVKDDALGIAFVLPCVIPLDAPEGAFVVTLTAEVESPQVDSLDADALA